MEFYKPWLGIYESKSVDNNRGYDVTWANRRIGFCLNNFNEPAKTLSYSRRAIEIRKKLSHDIDIDRHVAVTLHNIGRCQTDLHNYDKALINLSQALQFKQKTTSNAVTDRDMAVILNYLFLDPCFYM